ncbi:MAG: hypothetical protein HOP14_11700 [Acidobacteria bacterium]|nr:hypothetical protein [Acidobacteriota bacterium]
MRRHLFVWLVVAVGAGMLPGAAGAQTLNFGVGGFTVRGEDARVEGDVLNANRELLAFDIEEFNGPYVGVEWLVPFAGFFEAGAGIGFSRRTVPSVYADFIDADGTEIEQDLRLRLVPVAFSVRVVPFGHERGVQPYVGVGVGVTGWRYSESGEFVDFSSGRNTIFRDTFVASGTAAGPIALGGIRFASDTFVGGGEVRYSSADAELGPDFLGSRIDLGGWTYTVTFGVKFN